MRTPFGRAALVVAGIIGASLPTLVAPHIAGAGGGNRQISVAGSTSFAGTASGTDGLQYPEIFGQSAEGSPAAQAGPVVDRSNSGGPGHGASASGAAKSKSNPQLGTHFDGLNFRQQRLANGGNQFSLEPPDQALCANSSFVFEAVNDVAAVYTPAGSRIGNVTDLNTFFGYPAAINRTTGVRGPFVTDPVCLFDDATQRFYFAVLTLDTLPNGAFTGANHLDLAVSNTADPTGAWTIYRIPVQNDGSDGTPNHGCSFGPCIGDYPHIGADANGIYLTTNEYSLFGPEYKGAIIYALSKHQLASLSASVNLVELDTVGLAGGNPGFTVWPATSPAGQFRTDDNGTEFFLSSDAAEEANGSGTSTRIWQWTVSNTASLDTSPALGLAVRSIAVGTYAIPPKADQKVGAYPLGQCLADAACARVIIGAPVSPAPPELVLDSNDTRMQQVTYANGKLWGALDTAVTVGGANKAGIEYFIVNPGDGTVVKQGYLGVAGNNVTYPAIGVTASGRGVMSFTLVGADNFPSAAYASIDANGGVGDVHVAQAGVGPNDGFSGYAVFGGRPRWGDYGATALVGNSVWVASEYIAQTCTLAQYMSAPFGSCGGTRATLGNWATHISRINL